MRKLILLSILLLSSVYAYSQTSTFGGIGLRVNDSTSYQSNAAGAHSAGYYDIYFNNQAATKHWDVWNGSSYDHVFDFNGASYTFTPSDFNESGSTISIDYTNGQAASTSTKGFLTDTDWDTFNEKESRLTSNSASTASGTITLDMNSERQRMFVGSATFASSKTITLSNTTNALVFSFQFEVTNVAATLIFPSSAIMADVNWNSGTDTWTPPSTGKYECGGIWDGTYWRVKIIGPFN